MNFRIIFGHFLTYFLALIPLYFLGNVAMFSYNFPFKYQNYNVLFCNMIFNEHIVFDFKLLGEHWNRVRSGVQGRGRFWLEVDAQS